MNLDSKTVLITGASSGIGKAVAHRLAAEKCNLILTARRTELLEEFKSDLPAGARQPVIIKCDVSRKEEVAAAYRTIAEKAGKIDIAFLNAGVGRSVSIEKYNSDYAVETFGANLFGIVFWVEQLLPGFISRKEGMIAAVSSLADNRGFSGSGFYCASKAAVSVYLEGLRIELKPYNIKVATVKPGFVKTAMTDQNKFKMPFLMTAERAADIIVRGIKKEKRVIQFPLPMVALTRLVGLLPGSLYEWAASKTKI
jgi:short-subunit dehydrogenase